MTESESGEIRLRTRTQLSRVGVLIFLAGAALPWCLAFSATLLGDEAGSSVFNHPSSLAILLLVSALLVGVTFCFSEVAVYADRVHVRFFPFYRRTLAGAEIGDAEVVGLPFWRFGLGWRLLGGGDIGLISRNGPGLYLPLTSGGGYYISVGSQGEAEELAVLLRELSARVDNR